jgi:hypothetical protein
MGIKFPARITRMTRFSFFTKTGGPVLVKVESIKNMRVMFSWQPVLLYLNIADTFLPVGHWSFTLAA